MRLRPERCLIAAALIAVLLAGAGRVAASSGGGVAASAPAARIDGLTGIDRGPAGRGGGAGAIVIETSAPPFPSYGRLCGYPIASLVTHRLAEALIRPDGQPVIVLDPLLWAPGEEAHRIFLIAHECAHHRLGHLSPDVLRARRARPATATGQELGADCWAADTLARDGLDEVVQAMALRFAAAGPVAPGAGYPPGTLRAEWIRRCGATGRAARLRAPAPAR